MKIRIIGDGSFGSFLKSLLANHFTICDEMDFQGRTVILAVPIQAYTSMAIKYDGNHLVNVCSVQLTSTQMLTRRTNNVTSIHPLFGARTPKEKRHSILTHNCGSPEETKFLLEFGKISSITQNSPEAHDKLMLKTHVAAVDALSFIKPLVDNAADVPDYLIPHSFRLLREFAKTIEDMPKGTMDSILANPFRKV